MILWGEGLTAGVSRQSMEITEVMEMRQKGICTLPLQPRTLANKLGQPWHKHRQ